MRSHRAAKLVVVFFTFGCVPAAHAQSSMNRIANKEAVVTTRATGTFDVSVLPIATEDKVDTGGFSRLSIDKRFSGDLQATSRGQMVAAMTAVEGSGAYVAFERVTGTLSGRRGAFILQHSGTMGHGASEMRVTVVPDSGTGELTGLAGTMKVIIEGGKHSYEFEYTIGR
jgi:hypothetical protein